MEKAVFTSFRRGKHTLRNNQILLKIDGIEDRNAAARFLGRRVVWSGPKGTSLIGTITGVHGRRGVVRPRFPKGLPGQALGAELTIH